MANSLRSKIKKLCHSKNISEKMCNELLEKLEGHDRELRNKAIDEFAEKLKDLIAKNVEDVESSNDLCCEIFQSEIDEVAEQMKEEQYV